MSDKYAKILIGMGILVVSFAIFGATLYYIFYHFSRNGPDHVTFTWLGICVLGIELIVGGMAIDDFS